MNRILLVPPLPLERQAALEKYAHRLHDWLESGDPGFEVRMAAQIGALTRERRRDGRVSGAFVRVLNGEIDPARIILPEPFYGPHRYLARYVLYPFRVRREARRSSLIHLLDHGYAHMLMAAKRPRRGARAPRPVVVTVHDLMPVIVLRSPSDGWKTRFEHGLLQRALKALRLADRYVVGTEWLKSELATWLGGDARIRVVPFGVDRAFFSESPNARDRGRRQWRIPEDGFLVLHVGSTVERKNVPLVIHTVAKLRDHADVYLLQVGGRFTAQQEDLIDRLALRDRVRRARLADEVTLRRAYRTADVLLFPSLYEGFGFPVLEAFASGLPVVTSGAGGLKEVGGDAAVVVEGRDPGAYVEAILGLAEDPDRREVLVELGRQRAERYEWRRTADVTAEVYRELL